MSDVEISLEKLITYIEKEEFRGYDPYDAMNSPILRALSFSRKYPRIAWIQFMKRFPINLRPLLGIKKGYNPKGLGLFLWGYSKLYQVFQDAKYLQQTKHILQLLEDCRSQGYAGNCWGYNFNWQSRVFYVPKYTPTIVNSSFIGHALIDTYEFTQNSQALEMAISIKDFILKDLKRTKNDNGGICFSYTPIDDTAIHNANLLGASLLIRLYKYTSFAELREVALAALHYTMDNQKEDGSWHYAETTIQKWIDSFHTGFNLQCILYFLENGEALQYQQNFVDGVEFYAKHFFLEDGTPKYYHDRVYPIDIHAPAQALVFFSKLPQYKELVEKIFHWLYKNFQAPTGYFYFQQKKFYTNKIPYIRWGQAWAFHALTEVILQNNLQEL